MFSTRSRILHLIDQGILDPKHAEAAMQAAGVFPGRRDWYRFIERLLLGLGVLAMALGVVFFVAFNWDALGKFGKFALVEGALITSLLPLLRYDLSSRIGQVSLTGAAILVGALLALFGQTYQTGADAWQLFATWGVLILPWAVLGRFEPLWILWVGIVNVAIVLYFTLFHFFFFVEARGAALAMVFFNALVLIIWEYRQRTTSDSMRIGVRIVATLTGAAATGVGIDAIMDGFRHGYVMWGMVWVAWIILHCWIYRWHIRDLFLLSGGCLSFIVVGITLLGRALIDFHLYEAGSFLIMALALILAGSGAATWLRNTARSWENNHG